MKPKLTVIIPVYNAEKYIERMLDSVLSQTLTNIEVIIINDCSSDLSWDILLKYAKKDKRIILLNNTKNVGTGASRNKGIIYATGKYIGFVDNDDWVDNDYFEKMVSKIEENNSEVCVCMKITNHTNGKSKTHLIEPNDLKEAVFVQRTAPWAKIFSREFLVLNKIKFDLTRGEDIFPAFLSSYLSCNIAYCTDTSYHCRIRQGSISHKEITDFDLEEIKVYKKIIEYLNENTNTINKDYWIKKIKKRGMISFDFLYSNSFTKEMKEKVIKEYKGIFGKFSVLDYYIWKLLYKKEKFLSYLKGKN